MLLNGISALPFERLIDFLLAAPERLIDVWPDSPWAFAEVLPMEASPLMLMGILLSLVMVYGASKSSRENFNNFLGALASANTEKI